MPTVPALLRLALRQLWRESRLPELRLLFLALWVAVAGVSTVGFFTDRVGRGLADEAQNMLGGDLVLVSDHPIPGERRRALAGEGVVQAETRVFPSMVRGAERVQLADIKAVGAGYPLRGRLQVRRQPGGPAEARASGPARGEVWLDERLAGDLAAQPGSSVAVGASTLRVGALLALEPDRGMNLFSLAPRLMMNLDDLAATGLEQPGARIAHRLLAAGPRARMETLRQVAAQSLQRGERLEDVAHAPPEMQRVLERAQRFLGLAGGLTVILSAIAVALAARRYRSRQFDSAAMLRCLGVRQRGILLLHGVGLAVLAVLAAGLGAAAGYLAHFLLVDWLGGLLGFTLPPPGMVPLLVGLAVAAVLLFAFALPPLLQLARVPTLRVLRRELEPPGLSLFASLAAGWLALAALLLAAAGDGKLGAWLIGGFSAAILLFWALARLALAALTRLPPAGSLAWRHGLASLRRQGPAATLQVLALALGLMALLLLVVTRGQLLAAWQASIPPEAPNRFVINIQPEQGAAVVQRLAAGGIAAELAPMVRGRLLSIAGRPVSAADYPADEQAQRLVEREFNLSWRDSPPPDNKVVAGRWQGPLAGTPEASVEEGLAQRLGIAVGDSVVFAIQGRELAFRVSSLRRLSWDSMRVNFFVLTQEGVLDPGLASYITSVYLPPGQGRLMAGLANEFPNLSIIDTGAILEQLRTLIDRIASAVQFVFLFTLLAGLVVLFGSLAGALDARRREWAVLRALGARHGDLRRALAVELGLTGALAGAIAALGASAVGAVLARRMFQFDLPFDIFTVPLAAAGGTMLALAVGGLALRRIAATPPLAVLRASD